MVDNDSNSILFINLTSYQVHSSLELGKGNWCGLCVHGPHSASQDVLLAVTEESSNRVLVFDMKSKERVKSICQPPVYESAGDHRSPYYVCVHTLNDGDSSCALVLVSYYHSNNIAVFDFETGLFLMSIGSVGSDEGQLRRPGGIAAWTPKEDPTNAQVVVADRENDRIEFFRLSDGMHVRSVGEAGDGIGQISLPEALAIHLPVGGRDEDALVVTVGYLDARIHVYSILSGEYLRCLGGGLGQGVDQLSDWVNGIAFHRPDGEGETSTQVILSDIDNHRLQVFNLYSGEHTRSVGLGSRFPKGLCVVYSNRGDWDYVLK